MILKIKEQRPIQWKKPRRIKVFTPLTSKNAKHANSGIYMKRKPITSQRERESAKSGIYMKRKPITSKRERERQRDQTHCSLNKTWQV